MELPVILVVAGNMAEFRHYVGTVAAHRNKPVDFDTNNGRMVAVGKEFVFISSEEKLRGWGNFEAIEFIGTWGSLEDAREINMRAEAMRSV